MNTPSFSQFGTAPPEIQHNGTRGLVQAELVSSVAWLIRIRWLAGVGVILSTFVMGAVFHLRVPELPLYLIGTSILGYNLVFFMAERQFTRLFANESKFVQLALWQVGLDWAAMILLIHFSGGIESPAILFFVFHIIIASIFFTQRTAFIFALLAIFLVAGTTVFEYFDVIPHRPIIGFLATPLYQNGLYVMTVLLFFTTTCLVTAYLVSSIQERLRQREEEIIILTKNLRRLTTRLQALNEGARTVSSTLELSEVLNRLVESTVDAMGVRACSIRLLDKSGSQLVPAAVCGLSQEYLNKGPVDPVTNPLAREVLSGRIINIADVLESPMLQYPEEAKKEGIRSMLSAPLMGKDGTLGILRSYAIEPGRFTIEDEQFLATIAAQGSIAIENALAYQAIESLDSAKSKFIRIVTHELRSPVSVARSLLRTISAGYVGNISSQQVDILNRACRRLEFLQRLIDDLLDLAAGKTDVSSKEVFESVDLEKAVKKVIDRFEIPAREQGLNLEFISHSNSKALFIKATYDGIDRVFNNLLSNAIKYTPSGGEVKVSLSKSADEAEVVVEDSGIGIPDDAMEHLFEEFYRAPNAKSMVNEGTGLGLTITKDIITRFGGRLNVQSKIDEGTRIVVFLPLDKTHKKSAFSTSKMKAVRVERGIDGS
jgi:signal transduction histidine kinase